MDTLARNLKAAASGADFVIEAVFEDVNLSTMEQVFEGGPHEHHD